MCVVPSNAGIARDPDPALCGIALDFLKKDFYVDPALCSIALDLDPALCGIAQDLDHAICDTAWAMIPLYAA
jgi:hypothetical protein